MKKLLLLFAVIFSLDSTAQNVNIPDANFKSNLVGNSNINTNQDTEIQVSEAAAFTGEINVMNQSIFDLTGIEAFTALTSLKCLINNLTSLNVSANTALTHLECGGNGITSLNVSSNTALTYLYCGNMALTTLDVSANTALTHLNCYDNDLTSLDVSANTALNDLDCSQNSLTSLNVQNGNNTNFIDIYFGQNPNLTCVQVDDATWSNANWMPFNYSVNCSVGIPDNFSSSAFTVYPNPASTILTIENLNEKGIYQLQDITGKILLSGSNSLTKFNLDISAVNSGIYFLTLQTNVGLTTKKIEVVK